MAWTRLITRRTGMIDILSNRGGADETDYRHIQVRQQAVYRFLIAMPDVEYSIEEFGLFKKLAHSGVRARITPQWLQDEVVAAG